MQVTYNLSTEGLIAGWVMNQHGEMLRQRDSYILGIEAMKLNYLDHAMKWLESAIDISLVSKLTTGSVRSALFPIIDAIGKLATLYYGVSSFHDNTSVKRFVFMLCSPFGVNSYCAV